MSWDGTWEAGTGTWMEAEMGAGLEAGIELRMGAGMGADWEPGMELWMTVMNKLGWHL